MISGMAHAGRLLERTDFIDSATRALDFVRRKLWHDGRLLATAKDDRAGLNGYLDDYAFLIAGVLELLQARWRTEDLNFALALARVVLDQFEDRAHGGFYFTSHDHERLVYRPKPTTDEALPSGNGVAALVLLRLGHLLGDLDFLRAGERAIQSSYARIAHYPSAYCSLLIALEEYLEPPQTVVLRGAPEVCADWQHRLVTNYQPGRMVMAIPNDAQSLPGILADRKQLRETTAYLCSGQTCLPPVFDFADLTALLRQG
jgi:hypothetical protein